MLTDYQIHKARSTPAHTQFSIYIQRYTTLLVFKKINIEFQISLQNFFFLVILPNILNSESQNSYRNINRSFNVHKTIPTNGCYIRISRFTSYYSSFRSFNFLTISAFLMITSQDWRIKINGITIQSPLKNTR